jgi:hypothetical protein
VSGDVAAAPGRRPRLRVIVGPRADWFKRKALTALTNAVWTAGQITLVSKLIPGANTSLLAATGDYASGGAGITTALDWAKNDFLNGKADKWVSVEAYRYAPKGACKVSFEVVFETRDKRCI